MITHTTPLDTPAYKVLPLLSPCDIYLEPFLRAGVKQFTKQNAKECFINDKHNELHNFFALLIKDPQLLKEQILCRHHRQKPARAATTKMQRAVNFFYQDKCVIHTGGTTLNFQARLPLETALQKIDKLISYWQQRCAKGVDFEHYMPRRDNYVGQIMVYCEPPYVRTNAYSQELWMTTYLDKLLSCLALFAERYKAKYAVSDYLSEPVIALAAKKGLVITELNGRNPKNGRTELIITNYKPKNVTYE